MHAPGRPGAHPFAPLAAEREEDLLSILPRTAVAQLKAAHPSGALTAYSREVWKHVAQNDTRLKMICWKVAHHT